MAPEPSDRDETPFWRRKTLAEMNPAEWESLCDGCAKCCLHKLEDMDTGELAFTNVACRLLDIRACRCGNYDRRSELVPDCVVLDPAPTACWRKARTCPIGTPWSRATLIVYTGRVFRSAAVASANATRAHWNTTFWTTNPNCEP